MTDQQAVELKQGVGKYAQLEKVVLERLESPAGKERLAERRKKIREVAPVIKTNIADSKSQLRSRKGVWFSTTQGQAAAAANGHATLSVQMLGKEIGKLVINLNAERRYTFRPTWECLPNEADSSKRVMKRIKQEDAVLPAWTWSGDRSDARYINEYLKDCREAWGKGKEQEREIQWQLAYALIGPKKQAKEKVVLNKKNVHGLKDRRAVCWVGRPTEIGVCLRLDGELAVSAGGIDLMVRTRNGPDRWQRDAFFEVFEVKRATRRNDINDFENAVKQAIRYAIAIHQEANHSKETQADYRMAFGSASDAPLDFGVVIVIDAKDAERFKEKLEIMFSSYEPHPETSVVKCLRVLTYNWNNKTQTASGWKWFKESKRSTKTD
jgi:hypothetical protein